MKPDNFEKDVIKALKRSAREEYGLQPTRVQASKKAYNRKKFNKKIDVDDDNE